MKLNKLRKRLALLSSTTLLLLSAGCSKLENTSNTNTTTKNNTTEIEKQVSTELSEEDLKKFKLQEYKDFFDNFQIDYKIEDFLITDEEIDQIIEKANTKKECDFKWDKDPLNLSKLIIDNSHKYTQSHSEFKDCFPEHGNEDLRATCFHVLYMAMCSLSNSTNDINEDACRMQTLKIVVGNIDDDSTLAYYDDKENLIVISTDNIKSDAKENKINWEEKLYTVVMHEINLVRECACNCRLKKGDSVSNINYQNPMSFLVEAPAESGIYLDTADYITFDSFDYRYYLGRTNEAFLLLPILMENKNIDEYYNAIFDSDINSFCNFFNAKTNEEIKDLYKIIYCIDSINNDSDFANKYFDADEFYIPKYGELEAAVGYDYKKQIFKISLQNLINYTEENGRFIFSLKDNLILFNIIRDKVINDTYDIDVIENDNGDKNYIYKFDKNFFEDIKSLYDKYIEYLCFKYNVTKEDIDDLDYEVSYAIWDIVNYSCKEYTKVDNLIYAEDFCKRFPLIEHFERNLINHYFPINVLEKNIEYYDNDKGKNYTYNMNR